MSYANSYMREGTSYYRYNSVASFLSGGAPLCLPLLTPLMAAMRYAKVKIRTGRRLCAG